MNDITRPIEVIETEINFYKRQTATGIIEYCKRIIGSNATKEQIVNLAAHQFGVPEEMVQEILRGET